MHADECRMLVDSRRRATPFVQAPDTEPLKDGDDFWVLGSSPWLTQSDSLAMDSWCVADDMHFTDDGVGVGT